MVGMVRIAFGGMAATPKRAAAVEEALVGKPWNAATIEAAIAAFAEDFQPLTDMRASKEYRLLAAQNLLRRFHLETTGAGRTAEQGGGVMGAADDLPQPSDVIPASGTCWRRCGAIRNGGMPRRWHGEVTA